LPKSHSHKRNGADAAFARAITRAEFGRFYCDENDLREVHRSMARGEAHRRQKNEAAQPAANGSVKPGKPKAPTPKGTARDALRLRERRTELAEALQPLREAGKKRC
jgi:hypothetical protein